MLRKIIASLIFTIFVVASVPFFLGLTVGKTFLSRSFYRGALLDAAYQPLTDYVAGNVRQIDPIFAKYFSEEDIRTRFARYFTPDVLRQVIDQSLDQFDQRIASTSSDTSRKGLHIPLNLSSLISVSRGFFGELSGLALEKIPVCSEGELPIAQYIFPSCKFPSWQTKEFKDKFQRDFQNLYQDKMLAQFAGTKGDFSYEIDLGISRNSYLSAAKTFDMIALYMASFLLVFTILMLLLWVKAWDIGLRWVGSMWMTSAVLGGLIALFILISERFLSPDLFGLSAQSVQYSHIVGLFHVLSVAFLTSYVLFLLLAFIIGLSFFLFARRFDHLPEA